MDAVEEYKKLKELDPSIESNLVVKNGNSCSTDSIGRKQLNKPKNSKMTEKPNKNADQTDASQDESNESGDAEQKAMLKSISGEMKSLADKYDVVAKENVELKEAMGAISKSLAKITEALAQPIHKSQGVQKSDEKSKAGVQGKSVDPLELFK
jgi:hypothetical protein